MIKKLPILILFFVSVVSADYIRTKDPTKITMVSSYNLFGGGDVIFKVGNPVPECADGYWFTKNDNGFNANLSMIIAAYHAKSFVAVYGIPEDLWSGSNTGKFCKLYSLEYR